MCTPPLAYTPTSLLVNLDAVLGANTLPQSDLIDALNFVLYVLSKFLRSCFSDVVTFTNGRNVENSGCISPDATLEYQLTDGHYRQLSWWKKTYTGIEIQPRTYTGPIRVSRWVSSPSVPHVPYTLADDYDTSAPSIWLNGGIDNLPVTGLVRVDQEWKRYTCWQRIQNPQADLSALDNAARGGTLIDSSAIIEVVNLPCGTYTKLLNVTAWEATPASTLHERDSVVEFGIALPTVESYSLLMTQASINAYLRRINMCSSDSERQLFSQLYVTATQTFNDLKRAFTVERRPVGKFRSSYVDACC